ncbi:MAG: SBBP repeat-containing protein [Acidobacteriia bacterium]|nr:SBBP repeat-containing protein [Terriglobia bacterium]
MDLRSRLTSIACTTAFLLAILPVPANAQVIQWIRQFGTQSYETALAVATAPNAVYTAGRIDNGAFSGFTNAGTGDAFVSKLDLDGNVIWTSQFGTAGTDSALGVAADASGVYIVGSTAGALQGVSAGNGDAFVRKYDPNGNALWTRQFGGPNDDQASAAAVDATGLYVAGSVVIAALPGQTPAGGSDAFVRKYDFNGNELWTRQFGTSNGDKAYGIAVDASGVYVTGETDGELATYVGGSDYFLRKYDPSGNVVWTRQFGTTTTDGGGYGGAVAVNSSGVYVAGCTTGTFPGQAKVGGLWDAFVQKFDLNGNAQWTRQFGTSGDDWGYGIALGAQWVYATGQASSGMFLWRFDFNGADTGNIQRGTFATRGYGVATDSTGAYVAGGADATQLGQTGFGDTDAFVLKVPHPPLLNGVSDAFTGQTGVAPTTWTALYGSGLSTSTRTWDGAIQGTQLPAALDEVRVSINRRPATIFFVSPGQVNVLAPLDDTTGNVEVTLTNRYGTSPPIQVRKANFLPAFYAPFGESSGLRVTAVALDGTLVGKVGLDPRVTRAARPGEILQIFATGFGPTTPPAPSDTIFAGAPLLVTAPRITIGGREAAFIGNGNLVAPGLYQFNVTIPDLADGDHLIVAEAGGARSSATVFISVRR